MRARIPNLVQLIDLRRLYPDQAGRKVVFTRCPAHSDRERPNLAVYPHNTYCFVCGFKETALDHIKRVYEFTTTYEAMRIAEQILRDPADAADFAAAPDAKEPLDSSIIDTYISKLRRDEEAMQWLAVRYGLTPQTVEAACIGHTGTAFAIPVFGFDGMLQNIRYRVDPGRIPEPALKYWGVAGRSAAHWFIVPGLVGNSLAECLASFTSGRPPAVVLCEGELDALSLWQCGFLSLSGTAGAQSLLGAHIGMLRELAAVPGVTIFVTYDQDEAGQKAARSICETLARWGARYFNVTWDSSLGKDPSELVAAGYTRKTMRSLWHLDSALDRVDTVIYNGH